MGNLYCKLFDSFVVLCLTVSVFHVGHTLNYYSSQLSKNLDQDDIFYLTKVFQAMESNPDPTMANFAKMYRVILQKLTVKRRLAGAGERDAQVTDSSLGGKQLSKPEESAISPQLQPEGTPLLRRREPLHTPTPPRARRPFAQRGVGEARVQEKAVQRDDCENIQGNVSRSIIEFGNEGRMVTEGHLWGFSLPSPTRSPGTLAAWKQRARQCSGAPDSERLDPFQESSPVTPETEATRRTLHLGSPFPVQEEDQALCRQALAHRAI
ncbi:UNVERIFIED_CONTAM: hypothetical protein K2H54_002668 [Gekko kuhli]